MARVFLDLPTLVMIIRSMAMTVLKVAISIFHHLRFHAEKTKTSSVPGPVTTVVVLGPSHSEFPSFPLLPL